MSKLFESKKKIIDLLKEKPMTMTQISERLDLGQSTTNQHLKELLRIGAIKEVANPYSRKWKYYEYNKSFEKKLEDNGYNIAKVRAFAAGIITIAAIAVVALLLISNMQNPPQGSTTAYPITSPYLSSQPSASANSVQGDFVIQLTDPPLVPPGTNSLSIRYSSIGIMYANSSAFEYFSATGTANLLNLTNETQTIAVLNIKNYSKIHELRLNISSANITIYGIIHNVTVPQGYIETSINSSTNSSISGLLLNMNPTIVSIYSQSNASIFVMVPNVKAVFVGASEVKNTSHVGQRGKLNPKIREIFRSNSSIEITNATLLSNGNSTSISLGVRNTGNSTVDLTSLQLDGYMQEIMLGYQGYRAYPQSVNATAESPGCLGRFCISENAIASIHKDSVSFNQSSLEAQATADFVRRFSNYLNFIVMQNGTLELPVLASGIVNCPESEGIGEFIGCTRSIGTTIKSGSGTTLHFNGTLSIGSLPEMHPQASAIPAFGGITKILLIPNQSYSIRVTGVGENHSGIAYANYTAMDKGNISNYTSKLVGVSYVNEQVSAGNSTYNETLQGFTAETNGTENYALPLMSGYGYLGTRYLLSNISILTKGFTLLSITNVSEYIPGKCPVCTGEIHCLVCTAGRESMAAVLRIKVPDYQYYGPLAIRVSYNVSQYDNTANVSISMPSNSTQANSMQLNVSNATITVPETNLTGMGTIQGRIEVTGICTVGSITKSCIGSIDQAATYSQFKLALNQTDGTNDYMIPVSANGTYSQNVAAGLYSITLMNCYYLSCLRDLPKNVSVSANQTTELNLNISANIGTD